MAWVDEAKSYINKCEGKKKELRSSFLQDYEYRKSLYQKNIQEVEGLENLFESLAKKIEKTNEGSSYFKEAIDLFDEAIDSLEKNYNSEEAKKKAEEMKDDLKKLKDIKSDIGTQKENLIKIVNDAQKEKEKCMNAGNVNKKQIEVIFENEERMKFIKGD